jgi:hypothetical protein
MTTLICPEVEKVGMRTRSYTHVQRRGRGRKKGGRKIRIDTARNNYR